MNDKGLTIRNAFLGIRKLLEDVSILLRTAESELSDHGWKPAINQAVRIESQAIYYPRKWLPHFVWRAFTNTELPNVLAYITTVFILPDDDDKPDQPIVIAGGVQFKGAAAWKNLPWHHLYLHPYLPESLENGEFQTAEDEKLIRHRGVIRVFSMALPLVSITDAAALQKKVIEPLLGQLRIRATGQA